MSSNEPSARKIALHAVNLKNAGRAVVAESCARFALALAPNDPVVMANMGSVILTSAKSAEARRLTARAIEMAPDLRPKFLQNMGLSAAYSGDIAQALKYLREAEQTIDARFDLACFTLLSGDWAEGFKMMEVRRERDKHPAYTMPEWDGTPIGGTLWVEAEQGFGDMYQFARFLPWARERCGRLVFSVPAAAMAMFYGYPGVDEVRLQEENVPVPEGVEAHVPLQTLALLRGTTQENCPQDPGFFGSKAREWPVTVERHPRAAMTAGLVWSGPPLHPRDAERSMPFMSALPLLEESGVQFFSLQTGARGKDPEDAGAAVLIEDLRSELKTWHRTAAVIRALDLVITVDTAVAHLSGALGVPTWLLVSKVPDWRWGLGSDRTPWYPSVRIFRQKVLGEWEPVIAAVRASLRSHIEGKKKAKVRAELLQAAASNDPAPLQVAAGPHEPPRVPGHIPVA